MSDTAPASETLIEPPRRRVNWPLLVGAALVGLVVLLAIIGPMIAPKDPREHNLIIQIDGEWLTPPYPAFTPGYPLGSDNLGRDLYSWLLWSVRPTMILIVIVAGLRMALGIVIGVIAGWSDRWPGRVADGLTAAALSVPALIAALIVITAIGFRLGVWAFVVGLAITGWAEGAQLVREQTRTVKGQEAVEAAVALGASGGQIFFLHIVPHVMPMIWMLLAFEIANTLVTTAGLGFLGYYLGGAVFTEVDDFVYQRISEMPELGQMLATAWMVLDEPWAMVAAGTVVFLIVLGFNLVGDGLQSRLTRKLGGARALYVNIAGNLLPWLDQRVAAPAGTLARRPAFKAAALLIVVAVVGGGLVWYRVQSAPPNLPSAAPGAGQATLPSDAAESTPTPAQGEQATSATAITSAFEVPGDHIWANDGHDPWRTQWVGFSGPMTTTIQWTYEIDGSFTGGPAVDAEGLLYVAARQDNAGEGEEDTGGRLFALTQQGEEVWETPIDEIPVGTPALAAGGTLYVAGKSGLNAVSPQGEVLWHFPAPDDEPAVAGPIVSPQGTIFYKSAGGLVAVTSDGELQWQATITRTMKAQPPHLSADGELVLWDEFAFRAADGEPYTWEDPLVLVQDPLSRVVVGADGTQYSQYDVQLLREVPTSTEALEISVFDWSEYTWEGQAAGVTPTGRPWLLGRPAIGGMGLGFFWGTTEGELSSKLSIPGMREPQVIGIDADNVAYLCMDAYQAESRCVAFGPDADRPIWSAPFRGVDAISGASLAPGRLYIARWDGTLMAMGTAEAATPEQADADADASASATSTPESGPPITIGPEPAWSQPEVPGGHPWPMERRDAWGTLWADFDGPPTAVQRWVFELENNGFSGGPVVASDGTIYAGLESGELLAVDAAGRAGWRKRLHSSAVGTPSIGPNGTIYVTDDGAYLTAFSPEGNEIWRYHATGVMTETRRSSSGEILNVEMIHLNGLGPAGAGPLVAPDGTIHFSMAIETQQHEVNVFFRSEVGLGVSPSGESLLPTPYYVWSERQQPRLTANDDWLFWSDTYLAPRPAIRDQHPTQLAYYEFMKAKLEESNNNLALRMVTGADGRAYIVEGRSLSAWYLTPEALEIEQTWKWELDETVGTAMDGGATADGLKWLFFRGGKLVWITEKGVVSGPVRFPLESRVIAIDKDGTAFGCGSSMGKASICLAYDVGEDVPLWEIELSEGEKALGGALTSTTLYVTTDAGRLYALGSGPER
jgi:peptide/nickel transport system permease protein